MSLRIVRFALLAAVLLPALQAFASAPTATTSAATSITTSSALLNGGGNPSGEATTGWFRIGSTNPGTCSDTFGTRIPATGGTDLGSGSAAVPYSITATGLSSGTTYYFCAIVSNASGTAVGSVLSFLVPSVPAVNTSPVSLVTATTAQLNGSANPGGSSTTGYFRYATTNPGTCNDTFGTRAPSSGGTALGSGTTAVAYSQAISGLTPGTTYFVCALATNPWGTSYGAVQSFTASANAPAVATSSATLVTGSTAQLNGSANPGGAATTGWFRYSTTNPGTCSDTFGTRAPATGGTSLGTGNSYVSYSQGITGLVGATTYFFCAIAQNSAGTSVGSVLQFTTPSVPTAVTTSAASSVSNTTAYLNGSANPSGASTTGYFRYGLTNPGSCNDTFGSRAPASGGTSLGYGTSAVSFSEAIAGLSAGTTYYFCAIATNSEGTSFGSVLSFTTATAPAVTTSPATAVTATAATMNGSATPNGASTYGYFRYAATDPGSCTDSFGTRVPSSSYYDSSLGSGSSPVSFAQALSSLTPSTTYYFCAIGRNSHGYTYGAVRSFTTPAAMPTVYTSGATLLTGTTAQLNGSGNPGGAATTGWFRYATASPGTCNDSFGTRAPASGGSSLGSGNGSTAFQQGITGLTAGTTYYYCAIVQNSVGTAYGAVQSFTTPTPPTATTAAASSVGSTSAYLNGSGVPNGSSTTGYFRYATAHPGTCNDTFGSRAPTSGGSGLGTGTSAQGFSEYISGLTSGVTYYFCAIVQSAEGTAFGSVLSFTTTSAPAVTTSAATLVTSSSATLNGSANPNNAASYGYFRYSTTNPGTCTDSFGTRVPSSSSYDTSLGSGATSVSFSQALSGLTAGRTYYFCAIARNGNGYSFGAILSFSTLAALPVVSTTGATLLTGTGAQLNGSANPGGGATTGWFRWATSSPGTCNDTFGTRAPASGGSDLGSGTGSSAFDEAITGLTAGTTYYYCAIAENAVGKAYGTVASFVTPVPPTVATQAATSVTNTSAYLNGAGVPNGATTTGYFRYSATNPGTCDDMFGSRAPISGGAALGNGYSSQSFSESISGLSAGTTYYYCAITTSAEGTALGTVLSFTTATVPVVTTSPATLVSATTATINGSADPNGASAYGYFRYSTTDPGSCSDSFGTRVPSSSSYDSSLGSGSTPVAFAQALSSLTPATTYYFCAIGRNSYGTTYGAVLTFTTPAAAPTVSTTGATLLTGTTAQLNGSGNPGGAATIGWFRYSTTSPGTCNDSFGTRLPTTGGSNLGMGTSSAAFFQGATGLTAGTTYYYCALVQSAVGTAMGSVLTFTTPVPPTATTAAASSITTTTAYLNGSGVPNGSASTGYFRYATTSPGTCNDTFGSRAPSAGGTGLGTYYSAQSFSEYISGLTSGVTYYYCAIVQSAEGTAFGAVLSFTTSGPPAVTTSAATLVTASSATLNGSATPHGASAYGYFRYSTTNPTTCNDSFGTRLPSSSYYDVSLGAGATPVGFQQALSSLLPGTTYYFCAIARNTYGTSYGSVLSFTTLAALPQVYTSSASLLTGTTARLDGSANPGGAATTGWFRYSTTSPGTCNDTFGTRAPASGGSSLGSGTSYASFNQAISGLTAGTTYYYCAVAENSVGKAYGNVVAFTTPTPPAVTTTAASSITNTAAYLNGTTNPNGSDTTAYFRYSLSDPGTCNDTFGSPTASQAMGAYTTVQSFNQSLTGLSPNTTYYYCAIAKSAEGTAFGSVLSFTTDTAPSVTTSAATLVTSSSATLNGSADPNGDTAYGYFRYSTSDPIVCNDSFGTRVPSSSYYDTNLGAGSTATAYSQAISGLVPGTTYYFCAIARNSWGTSFGTVLSFTALVTLPNVSTSSASAVTTSTATLNGSANPNGANTSGWFRYATASPGTCNDSFGTRAPASGGSPLGGGNSYASYAQPITGLSPGTTYYYCAIASNSAGTSFGNISSFTTTITPTVNTLAATPVAETTATLRATVNPNGFATNGWFRYSTTNPGTCNDTFGTATTSQSNGSGSTFVGMTQAVSSLAPATTYYFCAIAQSSIGITLGTVLSFTTSTAPPSATTLAATAVTAASATLNATGAANGFAATGWFRWSATNPTSCNDTFGTRSPASGGTDLGSGNAVVPFTASLTGLAGATTYYYCAIAQNSAGTTYGNVLSFTTAALPSVTTLAASSVGSNTATLNGTGTANRAATTGWFRYSTTSPGATCNDAFGTRVPATGGADLGSGTTATPFAQALTGLTMGTTYYFCAIAENVAGKSYGAVQSFSTLTVPSVTTVAASAVGSTGATLNGSANPNGLAATGHFRYSLTDPGGCNDTFGTRAPASGGTSLGAGSAAVGFTQALTGLTAGATYYYCAIASNSGGTGFGAVMSFTTTAIPAVTTSPATLVASTTATLNGSANPRLAAATGYFRYSTTNPTTCNDTFGTRAPGSGGAALGAGSAEVPFAQALTGLTAATTYYYCAIANNAVGTGLGTVQSFTTLAAPVVTTVAASAVTGTSATLNATANPRLSATTGWFRYSTTSPGASCNDAFGTRVPATGGTDLGSGSTAVSYFESLTGLVPGTTYYFCAIAQNAVTTAWGSPLSFVAPGAPVVATAAATAVGATAATLNGSANPSGSATTGWFRYDTTDPGTCNDTFGTRLPSGTGGSSLGSGTTASSFSQAAAGLTPATTYYYCALAQNAEGTQVGLVLSFKTLATPTVTTAAATAVAATTATIHGTANPNGAATTGWFRYSTTSPGATCNDSFGTRTPLSGGTSLGSGTSAAPFSANLTGLTGGTTYYYCALASNSVGTSVGTVGTFTTPGAPNPVTTVAASEVTGTGATLHGSANPNAAATTGWFRYSNVSPGACNDTFGTKVPAAGTDLGSGSTAQAYSQAITGLSLGTTYYFCAIAQNVYGTRFGTLTTFTTLSVPTVTTVAASGVSGSGATLNGTANPRGQATTGWFRFDTSSPGTCNDAFGTRVPAAGGADLGSGTAAQAYSEPLIGLAPGTTYYYCAIAENSAGTAWGVVQSFVTPNAPTAVTAAATLVSQTGATLNGSGNPRGAAATGYFRWSATDPGVCDDSFGTRAPASGGASLGSGTADVPFSQALTGLTPSTTYWYCAVAESAEGKSYGALAQFVTQGAPTVTTDPATLVTSTGATLNGTVNANGVSTTAWHRYSTVHPGTCNNSFGTRAPTSGQTTIGTGTTPVSYSRAITGLTAGTTYYFCSVANNTVGMRFGEVLSFTTPGAPSVTTLAASAVSGTGATLHGSANPAAGATTGWFRYATANPGTCNDSFGTRAPASGGADLGSGTAAVPFSQALLGLSPGTTYWYCALASNASGTRFGAPMSFTTLATPTMSTLAATGVGATAATLQGSGNPNGDPATGWFVYSDSDPGVCDETFGVRVPATGGADLGGGTTATAFSEALTGLTPATTYYYCAIGANSVGTGYGPLRSFTTAGAPVTTTAAATLVSTTGATLHGTANPRGLATTGWFRWSATDPGACDDAFGTRAPASGGASLGSGSSAASFSQALTGLSAGTTYYYCAIAQNAQGTTFGAVLSFATPSAPAVATLAASAVTGSGATLHGSANPNGLPATGWFRYSTTNPGAACNDTFGTRSPTSGGASLGSGAAAAPYSQALTGLANGTTYYYCAIASNSAGTAFGAVMSFTTAKAPVVATLAAADVAGQSATLNGSANPGGAATTGWFRYSTTSPGAACNDTFGTRAPASGGSDLGGGSADAAFSQALAGLNPGTTYYYCAIAQNVVGTRFGTVRSFKTQAGPSATTLAASAVTGTGATLNGSANPNGVATTGWFRYAAANPGSCNDTFGTRAPASGGSDLGSGSAAASFSQAATGLTEATTYWYCAIAQSAVGTSYGALQSFTTPGRPVASTNLATSVSGTSATLNGEATGNGAPTTAWFRYAQANPGACDDLFGTRAPASGGTNVGSGTTAAPYSASLSGLAPGTTYWFCAIAQNSEGTDFGSLRSFTTRSLPAVTTAAATAVFATGATLNGAANPNGSAATGWFRYDTAQPAACDDAFGTRAPASGGTSLGSGSSATGFSQALSGLAAGTTYWYCAIASNAAGTSFGALMSLTTPASAPAVTTAAPTLLTGASATFHGAAVPNGGDATGYFRYATLDPGTCDDAFGTRAPASGGTSLGAGSASVPFEQAVSGLSAGTTYYVCALAQNAAGVGVGSVVRFTTPGLPAVTTRAATGLAGSSATLNGSANPNRAETTAWFRYDKADPGGCNDTFGTRAPQDGGTALGAGSTEADFAQEVTGLEPGTTYWFCAIADNAQGTAYGAVMTLRTPGVPQVTTSSATDVTATAATLNGAAVPNGTEAIGYFRWSTTQPADCDEAFGTREPATGGAALGAGEAAVPFAQGITGLSPGATVWFCALAQSSIGTGFGSLRSFQVAAPVPVVQTLAATDVEGTSATVNGTVNPNGTAAIGWFRYSTTAPTAAGCTDTFGTRAPAEEGVTVGGGTSPVPYSVSLAGLTPNTRYWFCAIGSNVGGAGLGSVRSFTTQAVPPSVVTQEATVAFSKGTLNATVNPNGMETTGWFQFDTVQPEQCDEAFGRRVPTDGVALGAGLEEVPLVAEVGDLTVGTTYWYCAAASSEAGTVYGEPMSVTVPAPAQQGCGCGAAAGAAPASLGLAVAVLALIRRRRH